MQSALFAAKPLLLFNVKHVADEVTVRCNTVPNVASSTVPEAVPP